jgi:hypothetical protein
MWQYTVPDTPVSPDRRSRSFQIESPAVVGTRSLRAIHGVHGARVHEAVQAQSTSQLADGYGKGQRNSEGHTSRS